MNAELLDRRPVEAAQRRRLSSRRASAPVAFRSATAAEAPALHAIISAHAAEGHLLPRPLDELRVHASRFVVAVSPAHSAQRRRDATVDGGIVGCAELAPLGDRVAEVRSLVVDKSARALGIGRRLVEELQRRARREGFEQLCAFTHDAGYFARLGFSIVPHVWVPEKIARDCRGCDLFRRCGQYAVILPLAGTTRIGSSGIAPLAIRG